MLSLNVIITQTSHFGLVSPLILGLIVVFICSLVGFVYYENKIKHPLVDFSIFKIEDTVVQLFQTLIKWCSRWCTYRH